MNITEDIDNIAHSLLDFSEDKKGEVQTVIYNFYDNNRDRSYPFFKHPNSLQKMEENGYLKIIDSKVSTHPAGIYKTIPPQFKYFKIIYYPALLAKQLKKNKNKLIISELNEEINKMRSTDDLPFTYEENGIGYLKFYKNMKGIKIGSIKTRYFRFLKYMLDKETFYNYKTVTQIFEKVKLDKDETNPMLEEYYQHNTAKRNIIINSCIKQLQKEKYGIQGKIIFDFNPARTQLRTVFIQKESI